MKKIILFFTFLNFATATDHIREYEILKSEKQISDIAKSFEIVSKNSSSFNVYVLEEKANDFLKLVTSPKLINKDIHASFDDQLTNGYKKYNDVENTLKYFSQKYSSIVTLETYGQSEKKRNLYALKLDTKKNKNKSEIFITAATHGDELMPVEVLLKTMEELFNKYGTDIRITKMLDDKTIYFIPVVSPDSFESRSRYVGMVDPNRSYPWPEDLNNRPVDVISSLMVFFQKHNFKASMDLHAFGRLVMYPWGYTETAPSSSEDVNIMNDIVSTMAKENDYTHGQISTTIYIAKGNSADYYYWKNKTKAIAVEIGDDKIPDITKLPSYVNESREMFYKFLEYNY